MSQADGFKFKLKNLRMALFGVALFSGAINILMLTGSVFMLQIYDRVIPSRSIPTLVGLAALVASLFLMQGLLDLIRARIMVRIAASFHGGLSSRIFRMSLRLPLMRTNIDAQQPMRDLDQIRNFLCSSGPLTLFDLPWLPFFLALCFLFHPLIGWTALIGALILVVLMIMAETFSRKASREAAGIASARYGFAQAAERNAEVVTALGMAPIMSQRWREVDGRYISRHQYLTDVSTGFSAFSKVLRMALQSAVLGVGALLVIWGEATGGVIIAASIISGRALAPVELALANWSGFISARQSWRRLSELLAIMPEAEELLPLRPPKSSVTSEQISVAPPGENRLVVRDVTFQLKAGMGLAIVGPSGSGKSSLVRALVGAWSPARGKVRLDGAALDQWSPESRGRHVGYLPQDVELFAGTVAQNIARFRPDDNPDLVIDAAMMAGVHQLILALPQGYQTPLGGGGASLSAGQRQRLALARALYGDPFLVVLDEPNSNLDADGEQALIEALQSVCSRGSIAVVVAHRTCVLAALDHVLVMSGGEMKAFGPKDSVLGHNNIRPMQPASAAVVRAAVGGVAR